ncbi:hypothetical protein EDB87DRAFT_1135599 [Lactarius vividus]|nr:hypothetical protein EDB87DRAFT_1135599 [Lactarius vividus]
MIQGLSTVPTKSSAFALYRSLRKQARLLPHEYLRQFFYLRLSTYIRSALDAGRKDKQRLGTFKRLRKELSTLKLANNGHRHAFDRVLDLAYGRKGPLRWSIMAPLLSDPTAPVPARIISPVERSRPPVYSPELAALLLSPYSRSSGRALKPSHLHKPSTLPSRADPTSEDARLFGPLSKRREVNIRWRYFSYQWKRINPPIEISVKHQETQKTPSQVGFVPDGIRGVGLQGAGLLEELKMLAGTVSTRPVAPRRIDSAYRSQSPSVAVNRGPSPNRYLRRRYRELLGRIPILTHSHVPGNPTTATASNGRPTGKYEVSLAVNALSRSVQHETAHTSEVDAVDLAWFLHGKPSL